MPNKSFNPNGAYIFIFSFSDRMPIDVAVAGQVLIASSIDLYGFIS
jgi:hypothetical protein